MNYFAHGRPFVDDPYLLAGTAVPDWLSVVNRKSRARERLAREFIDDSDARVAAIARGIVQHHQDDAWFHATRAFAELSMQFTVKIRDLLPPDDGFRPSFLGHILVELLLDAALISEDRSRLDEYYRAFESIDPEFVASTVNRMVTEPAGMLASFIPRFIQSRFLFDYLEDETLLLRVNNVMRRVELPALPLSFTRFLRDARQSVQSRKTELLTQVF